MNKEMLKRLKDIHLLYSMPMMAQNMRPEHYAIVEYEKLAYEQQAIIDQLTNNWNELEKELKEYLDRLEYCAHSVDVFYSNAICNDITNILDKMKEIREGNNVSDRD